MTKPLQPAIRFKGFTDAWEQRKLPEFVEFFSGLTYTPNDVRKSGTLVLRSSNVSNGEIVDVDNVYVNSQVVNSENVKVGDIIVVVRNGSRSLIGKHAQIKAFFPNTVIGAFMAGIRSDCPEFTNALLDTQRFEEQISINMGATINQITGYMFSKMEFKVPYLDEQEKIGKYFAYLDNLITLHQRKLDQLNELKKTLLQKMFPKKDEKIPEYRFPGYTDAWEQRKLGEIAQIVGGGTPSTKKREYWNGNINWFSPAEIGDIHYLYDSTKKITELGLKKSSAKILPIGTILFTSRAGIGKSGILAKESTTNQGFQSIIPNDKKLDNYFLYAQVPFIKRYAERVGAGSTFTEVSGKQLGKFLLKLPILEEQNQVGTIFKIIDNTITLHQHKLELLQDLKKTLLQRLFV